MIRWGILGAGRAAERFARSVRHVPDCRIAAVAARDEQKAQAFADAHGVCAHIFDYDALIADSEVDAVYLALPHGMHKEWAVQALRAGKAVLCEKPTALCAQEVREIQAAAEQSGMLFMEAMKTRFVPLFAEIRRIMASGCLGELCAVQTSLCNLRPGQEPGTTYHTVPAQGGALLDCGIYCAGWLEMLLPQPLQLTALFAHQSNGVDDYVDARFSSGVVQAQLECAFDRRKPRTLVIHGSAGRLEVDELHRPQSAMLYLTGKEPQRLEKTYSVDDFYGEIDHFVRCLREGQRESPVMPLHVSLRCAEMLDTIRSGLRYTEQTLAALQAQEDDLQFDTFGNAEVMALGNALARLAEEYDRGVGAAITRESDGLVVFQYMMQDKALRNLSFMEGKRQAVRASGHCSPWLRVENTLNGKWQDLLVQKPRILPGAGAFPIRVKGEHVATVSVSGLHEGRDHELIVRALCHVLDKPVPPFPWAIQ